MKLAEVFAGFLKAAAESGLTIEADEMETIPAQETTAVVQPTAPAPVADTSAIEAEQVRLKADLEAAQAKIAAMETAARDARLTALASTFYGSTADHVAVLSALGEESAAYTAYVTQQRAATEALRASGLFAHAGSERAGGGQGSAWGQIEAKARALMAQQQGLTFEKATVQVMDADPNLYRQYVSEA